MTKTEKAIFDEIKAAGASKEVLALVKKLEKAARDAGARNGVKSERNFAKLRNSSWAIKQEEELKLDDLDVVPYRVWKYLEELGWEQSGYDRNGWEMDFYISFKKEDEPKLQLRGSGMYGGLYFYFPGVW